MQKREPFQVDEAETSAASQTDLETEVENEKVRELPKNFQHTSDKSFLEEEIPGVDLDNAMDIGAEIQPIEETSLEEIKQSDNFSEVDENTSEPPFVIKKDEKETPDTDAGQLTKRDHNGETLKQELKTDIPVQEAEVVEKTLAQTLEKNIFIHAGPKRALYEQRNPK